MTKYRVTSQLITSRFEGIVEAKNVKEAIQKFEEGDTIGETEEYPECEQINFYCEKL